MIFFRIHTKKKWNYKREKSLKLAPRLHFRCEDTACVCETGWRGHRCEEQDCDPRCSLHGQCKNGTCLCVAGWNGLHCTLEGCPRGCSNHGSCKADFRGMYYFNCFNLTSLFCIFSWNWISRKKFQFFSGWNWNFPYVHMWRITYVKLISQNKSISISWILWFHEFFLQGNGVAIATKVGKVLIVVFVWKHVAMMDMTMIKVKQIKFFFL